MIFHLPSSGWRACAKAAAAASMAGLLMTACGGGDGGGAAPLAFAAPSAAPVVGGDGAASAEVPIVTAPSPGPAAQTGAEAPRPNSRLDCAP